MSYQVITVTDLAARELAGEFDNLAAAVSFAFDLADRAERPGDVSSVTKVEIRSADRLELSISVIRRLRPSPDAP